MIKKNKIQLKMDHKIYCYEFARIFIDTMKTLTNISKKWLYGNT